MAQNQIVTDYDDAGFPQLAAQTTPIAAGAGTQTLKTRPGRVLKAVVTAAGTATDNATIYDNTAGSGTILAVIPGGGTVGAVIDINMPAAIGITVVNVASGPAFTLGWS